MKKIIHLNESDLRRIIKESVDELMRNRYGQEFRGFIKSGNIPNKLYHTSDTWNRFSIYELGLLAMDWYKEWWNYEDNSYPQLPDAVFMSTLNNLYIDDSEHDVWEIDTNKLDRNLIYTDPSDDMKNSFCYHGDIPSSAIRLVKQGSDFDEDKAIEKYECRTGKKWDYRQISENVIKESIDELTAYHGSPSGSIVTGKFKKGKNGYLGPGIYFTDTTDRARHYARKYDGKGTIYTVEIILNKPLELTSDNQTREFLLKVYGTDSVYRRRSSKQAFDTHIITSKDINKLYSLGYDGVKYTFSGETDYVVYDNSQIKIINKKNIE